MKIALWQLGSIEHKITPTKEYINRVRDMIKNLDENKEELQHLVCGPDLSVTLIDTDDNIVLENAEEQIKKLEELFGNELINVLKEKKEGKDE